MAGMLLSVMLTSLLTTIALSFGLGGPDPLPTDLLLQPVDAHANAELVAKLSEAPVDLSGCSGCKFSATGSSPHQIGPAITGDAGDPFWVPLSSTMIFYVEPVSPKAGFCLELGEGEFAYCLGMSDCSSGLRVSVRDWAFTPTDHVLEGIDYWLYNGSVMTMLPDFSVYIETSTDCGSQFIESLLVRYEVSRPDPQSPVGGRISDVFEHTIIINSSCSPCDQD